MAQRHDVKTLAKAGQPNGKNVSEPNWEIIALHPTDPSKDIEISDKKWPE